MTWRSVIISRPATLRREQFRLAIEQDQKAHVPFEDIAVIVLNHREILLTHPMLSACADYGISVFSTGDNHQPNGVFLPYLSHSRGTRMMRLQLQLEKPLTKRAWARIIKTKIDNQAICLKLSGHELHTRLESLARRMRSGDPENLEAQASALYFRALFGSSFDRSQAGKVNASLNYGYAIFRGAIARGLVAHGFLPSFGLFHHSEQNAFNLADDIIEPFRPIVDLWVMQSPAMLTDLDLTPSDKVSLVALLNIDVVMPRGQMSALSAIEQMIESVARMMEGAIDGEHALELPTLIPLAQNTREM